MVKIMLIDSHCHLDLYPNFESLLDKIELSKIHTITMTTTPRAWERNFILTRNKRYIRAALGLHPQLADQCIEELNIWKNYLHDTHYVGEVGLDASPYYYKSFEKQKYIFKNILQECSKNPGKIISVHSVRCINIVLDMIENNFSKDAGTIILHWFSGNKYNLERAIKLGCYFSINTKMCKVKNRFNIVSELPLDRILTETDGPFIKIGSQPSTPLNISTVLESISNVRDESYHEIQMSITNNFLTITDDLYGF